ncbi:hypothetical protein GCM10010136_15010 [Limoniibacter endophyticus]|uniref:Tail tube GTA-gp10-like protein n=2 Tax=Limoniibacter endophyticus TaxID=1565040 RepID=A0A8J3GH65_9HYPH|nr:hypothetical protein GCM10010136_15010 [Limoniibacter endophyticus]
MANRLRGEIAAILSGQEYKLCLTLGALAELENSFAEKDINALIARFATGRFSSSDLIRILGAGLRGAGNRVTDDQVATLQAQGGAAGMAKIAIELLTVTFGKENVAGDVVETSPAPIPRQERDADLELAGAEHKHP